MNINIIKPFQMAKIFQAYTLDKRYNIKNYKKHIDKHQSKTNSENSRICFQHVTKFWLFNINSDPFKMNKMTKDAKF